MKYLVIGKGFIGSQLGKQLNGEVKYLDRTTGDYKQDVTEEFEIEEQFDVVYHTVGLAPGFAKRKQYEKVHVEGTKNIVDAVNTDKIVYISAMNPEIDHPFFSTKKEAEKIIRDSDITHTIMRPSTVIGEGNKLLEMMKNLAFTRVFPKVSTTMQPVKLDDLVECLEAVADKKDNETLDIGGPEQMTVSEMAKRLYKMEGYSCTIIPVPQDSLKFFLNTVGLVNIPPLTSMNSELIGARNTTENNHAPQLTELQDAFS